MRRRSALVTAAGLLLALVPTPAHADGAGPVVTAAIAAGTEGPAGWWRTNVTVSLAATDTDGVASITYRLDTAANPTTVTAASARAVVTGDGTRTLTFYATDTAGNRSAEQSLSFRLDTTAPVVVIDTPADKSTFAYNASVAFSYRCSDALSGLVTCTAPVTSGGLLPTATWGTKTVTVTATDAAGNAARVTRTYTVTAPPDTTAPTVTATVSGSVGEPGWYRSDVTVALKATDDQGVGSVYYAIDGALPRVAAGASATAKLTGAGTHTIEFWAVDAKGNTAARQTRTVTIDTTAPVVTLDGFADQATFAVGAPVTVTYRCDDAALRSCTGTQPSGSALATAKAGAGTFTVTGRDAAGNTSTVTRKYTVTPTPALLEVTVEPRVCDAKTTVRVGLSDAAAPLTGARVLLERLDGTRWVQVAALTTNADGTASATTAVAETAVLRARFAGSTTHAATQSDQFSVGAATAETLTATATTTGLTTMLAANVRTGCAAAVGAVVSLWRNDAAGWVQLTTVTTDAAGAAAFPVIPATETKYQLRTATSTTDTFTVAGVTVKLVAKATSSTKLTVTVSATRGVAPVGGAVELWRKLPGKSWSKVTTATTAATGSVTVTVTGRKGTQLQLRVPGGPSSSVYTRR